MVSDADSDAHLTVVSKASLRLNERELADLGMLAYERRLDIGIRVDVSF